MAELVLAEIVLLMRGIPARNAAAHRGGWIKTAAGSREARGKTLGIVGYGHIGTQIGVLAESLGMQVVFYDIEMKLALGNARPMPTLRSAARNRRRGHAARARNSGDQEPDRRYARWRA